jgi:predicted PurR-regulated permease PerM
LVWRAYYLIKKDNYLKISTLLICIFSVFAIILNIEGSNCIVQINSLPIFSNSSDEDKEVGNNSDFINRGAEVEQQQQQQQQQGDEPQQQQQQQQKDANTQSQEALMEQSYELRKYCFLVTNLYVYSLFGIIIGFIILVLWYIRYKKIWSWKKNGPIN